MKISLNGWQRLWVFVCSVYLIPVLAVSSWSFPNPSQISHEAVFEEQLTPESRSKLAVAEVRELRKDPHSAAAKNGSPPKWSESIPIHTWNESAPIQTTEEVVSTNQIGLEVKMPNGHFLLFKKGLKDDEMQSVAREYFGFLERRANKERLVYILQAFFWWAVPSISLYVFGWTIGWVRRGFKESA